MGPSKFGEAVLFAFGVAVVAAGAVVARPSTSPMRRLALRGGAFGASGEGAETAAAEAAGLRCEYLSDSQARHELESAGVTVPAMAGCTGMAGEDTHATGDLEDAAQGLHEEKSQAAVSNPEIETRPRKKGLLTSTPQELRDSHPAVYALLSQSLGDLSTPQHAAVQFGAASYRLIDALAEARRHRREFEATNARDPEFAAFLSSGSQSAELLSFGLEHDDPDADIVAKVYRL